MLTEASKLTRLILMGNIVTWIRQNKLVTVLVIVIVFLLLKSNKTTPAFDSTQSGVSSLRAINGSTTLLDEAAPAPEAASRLVVQWSNLSLQVRDVTKTLTTIKTYAEGLGGYMVDSSLANPQKVTSGSITIRVPSIKLDETLVYLRGLAVQVVSEKLTGKDVTDQYTDTAARLAILTKTKARFEELSQKAITFNDIMEANRQILAIQDQIDALNGQQKFLEKTAEMAKVTVYLSTDEYSLPYSPSEPWRPDVIFKTAVRSLVANAQSLGSTLIWLLVYSVVIVPAGLVAYFLYKKFFSKRLP